MDINHPVSITALMKEAGALQEGHFALSSGFTAPTTFNAPFS
jgi:orotate phosphoribosyltransferase